MSEKAELLSFERELRGALILADMLRLSIEAQLHNPNTTGWLAKDMMQIQEGIGKLFFHMERANAADWASIKEELAGDKVANLHWMLDECLNVGNLETVIGIIRECKTPVKEG